MTDDEKEFALLCFSAMQRGLASNVALLSVAIARVAPESLVVAACAQGLLDHLPADAKARVLIEDKKRDLVVERASDPNNALHFEFKMLWAGGEKECVDGICKDADKLAKAKGGYLVAAAFRLEESPEHYRHAAKLDELVVRCDHRVTATGARKFATNAPIDLSSYGAKGQIQLVTWHVEPAVPAGDADVNEDTNQR